jgi:hypothetical protein
VNPAVLAAALLICLAETVVASPWEGIEDDARRAVLRQVPGEHQRYVRFSDVQVYRYSALGEQDEDIGRLICGVVDFRNPDDGYAHFAVYYLLGRSGEREPLDEPVFYGVRTGEVWNTFLATSCEGAERRVQHGRDQRINVSGSD